jgi:hypothetical protein
VADTGSIELHVLPAGSVRQLATAAPRARGGTGDLQTHRQIADRPGRDYALPVSVRLFLIAVVSTCGSRRSTTSTVSVTSSRRLHDPAGTGTVTCRQCAPPSSVASTISWTGGGRGVRSGESLATTQPRSRLAKSAVTAW